MARNKEKPNTERRKATCRVGLDIGLGAIQSAVEFNWIINP